MTQLDSWYDELFRTNRLKRTDYLTDRLIACQLVAKANNFYASDRVSTDHRDFAKYMMMTEDKLLQEVRKQNLIFVADRPINRIDVIRGILE